MWLRAEICCFMGPWSQTQFRWINWVSLWQSPSRGIFDFWGRIPASFVTRPRFLAERGGKFHSSRKVMLFGRCRPVSIALTDLPALPAEPPREGVGLGSGVL